MALSNNIERSAVPAPCVFGNTLAELKRVSIVGLIVAIVIGTIAGLAAYTHGRLYTHWETLIIIPICIGGILPLVFLPTCLFSIQIKDDQITHVFCRRIILSHKSLSDLTGVDVGESMSGILFRFKDGSAIRFVGAHLRIIDALCAAIQQKRPDFKGFRLGKKAGNMLAAIKILNPDGR